MKTFLSLITSAGLLGLATQARITIPTLSSAVAFSFSAGLLVWMVTIYRRAPRALIAARPLHLSMAPAAGRHKIRAKYRQAA